MTRILPPILWALPFIFALLIANAQPVMSQEAVPTNDGSGQIQTRTLPWSITCVGAANGTGLDCQMSRAMVVGDDNSLLLRLTVKRLAADDNPSLLLQLPHGIYLPDGVSFSIDKNPPSKEIVQTCDSAGCYVGLAADRAFLPSFQQGETLKVNFQNFNRALVTIDLPLDGFTKAYTQMAGN